MPLNEILEAVDKAINDPSTGILKKINDLMVAADDKAKQTAVVGLIGSIISLVIQCIKAAAE